MTKPPPIRQARPEDLKAIHDWTLQEGWNPGPQDARIALRLDPQGFWVASGSDENNLLGSISGIRYPDRFAFIGYFLVPPPHRGGRIGPALAARLFEALEGWRLGMDGVEQKVVPYQHHGFEVVWNNVRQEGRVPLARTTPTPKGLEPLSPLQAGAMADLDAESFPVRREDFWKEWLALPGSRALGIRHGQGLAGGAVARPCHLGWKIGPLFASGASMACDLLRALLDLLPPQSPFYVDMPDGNPQVRELIPAFGLTPVFRTARMVRGAIAPPNPEKLFGVTSFELG